MHWSMDQYTKKLISNPAVSWQQHAKQIQSIDKELQQVFRE